MDQQVGECSLVAPVGAYPLCAGPDQDQSRDQDHGPASRHLPQDQTAVACSLAKRVLDVVCAAGALLLLSPLLLLIGVVIQLETPGPAVFQQRRGGLGGKPFVIYKFRSMTCREDGVGIRHATREDQRVTRFGAYLRRTSLDELPQLINVLKGDMSLVGPRPHALAHDEYYGARVQSYKSRMLAKPGITGLAQVSGWRGEIDKLETMSRRVAHDIAYIENWSFLLDVKLILLTVARAPFDPQAY
jgi:putative colanic acid biosynthesis UDP-glucose lipid carrier transferase